MLVKWVSQDGSVYVLAEGEDRAVGKRVGPFDLRKPVTAASQQTPRIDAAYLEPEEKGNRSCRVSFSVSIEFATHYQALFFVSRQAEDIPNSGTLYLIDETNNSGTRIVNCVLQEVDPVESGVAVDVRYSFIGGASYFHQDPVTLPAPTLNPEYEKLTVAVRLSWTSVARAETYELWGGKINAAGQYESVKLLQSGLTATEATHSQVECYTGYYYRVRAMLGIYSGEISEMVVAVGYSAPTFNPEYEKLAGAVLLSWSAVPGALTYELWGGVRNADQTNGPESLLQSGITTTQTTHNQTATTGYYYRVRAINSYGYGEMSFPLVAIGTFS